MNKIRAIFFDLDGTLAPLDEPLFVKLYLKLLSDKAKSLGYDPMQFAKALGEGIRAMYTNDGKESNETVFWKPLKNVYPKMNKEVFDDFYENDFKQILVCVGQNKYAKEIVDYCNKHFDYVVLSTNPLFPKVATLMRMEKVGLKESDFTFITSYENSSFCKPNPAYFVDLLEKFHLKKDEVLVLGNNTYEDCHCAFLAGITSYLIGDGVIEDSRNTMTFPHIDMDKVIDFLKSIVEGEKYE